MTARTRTRRGGFLMIVALTVLAVVAIAAALVLQLAQEDVRRTMAERREAQERLFLLAGLRTTAARLAAGEAIAPGAIALPGEGALSVDAAEAAADRAIVTMTAGQTSQRATFVRSADGAWSVERTEIVRATQQ